MLPARPLKEPFLSKSKDAKVPAAKSAEKPPVDLELEGLMSDIESGLREDELKKIWRRWGSAIIAGAIVLVLGVAGYGLWKEYNAEARTEIANRYDAAVTQFDAGKYDAAAKEFAAIAPKSGPGYSALARLQEASAKLQQGDNIGAIAAYKALGDDKNMDPVFRDLGIVLRVMHSLDSEDPKTLQPVIAPLLVSTNPYYFSALELASLLAARQGDKAKAAQLAEQIENDPSAPQGVRERARNLATLFGSAETAAAQPAPVTPAPAPSPATPAQGK
jgi:hypothetical protein